MSNNLLITSKLISKIPCMSFPLVGNLSEKEGFWTSQNDIIKSSEFNFNYGLFSNFSLFTLHTLRFTIHGDL